MTFEEALTRAAAIHNSRQGRRVVQGTYPDQSVVHVERAEEHDQQFYALAFAVTIRLPLVGEDTRICAGPDGVKAHLRARRLPVAEAEWRVEKGHTP